MAGRRVDKARARVVGDVIAGEQGHVVVPFAVRPLCPAQGVGADQRGKFFGWHVAHPRPHAIFQPRRCQRGPGQRVGQQIAVADIRPAFVRRAGHLIKTVGDAGTEADRAVLRQGPGRGGPDDHFGCHQVRHVLGIGTFPRCAGSDHRKLHPDRIHLPVVILDLGLGQRGLLHRRPHHRLRPLIDQAVHQELLELRRDHRLGVEIHRQIRIGPVAGDAQPLELLALDVDPTGGELATFLTELHQIDGILVAALLAIGLLDLPFDRQPVTIPTGHVSRVETHHLMRPDDHVLQRLVQRVPDVQVPVRIGRSVVQDIGIAALFFTQAVIDADLGPTGQPLRLALGQARPHRKIGDRQIQRGFVVGGFGAHRGRPSDRNCIKVGADRSAPWPGRPCRQGAGGLIRAGFRTRSVIARVIGIGAGERQAGRVSSKTGFAGTGRPGPDAAARLARNRPGAVVSHRTMTRSRGESCLNAKFIISMQGDRRRKCHVPVPADRLSRHRRSGSGAAVPAPSA